MKCKTCNKLLEISKFHPNQKFCCKSCYDKEYRKNHKIKIKDYREYYYSENREYLINRSIIWGKNNKDKRKISLKKYFKNNYSKNRFKLLARKKFHYHKKNHPELYPKICIICNSIEKIEFHHPNYDFPLSVYPLCGPHHAQIHRVGVI